MNTEIENIDILNIDNIMEKDEENTPKEKRRYVKLDKATREVMKASIVSMIRAGITHWELMDQIKIRWGLEYAQAQKYISVVREQLHQDYLKYADNVAETNISTLHEIRNQAMMQKNYKVALNAVDLLNKMTDQYVQKVDMSIESEKPIEIEFKS